MLNRLAQGAAVEACLKDGAFTLKDGQKEKLKPNFPTSFVSIIVKCCLTSNNNYDRSDFITVPLQMLSMGSLPDGQSEV